MDSIRQRAAELQAKADALRTTVREDNVAAVREQIATGTYEDDRKLDIAVDRLLLVINSEAA
ncbi:MAG: flagellar biosynthesis anti-sigma factor FlgM [bacterium]|nr:flagellar biosynthesis anti-sigma factor FlgM [bacterium]